MTTLPIFFTFDNNYVVPAAVAFWSLLDKAKKGVFYELYVLHHDITDENQELLKGIVANKTNGELRFINTGNFLCDEWGVGNFEGHNSRKQFTSDTLVRCFAARFFPDKDKIIYSDVDVVFMDDISELWSVDIEGVYVAGVKNAFMKWSAKELSHLSSENFNKLKDSYLAGGIWVMNLKKIREDDLEAKMISIISDDTIVKRWNDQDVINIACAGNVAFIQLNYIAYPYLLNYLQRGDFVSHYSRDELYDSVIHPKIIHYAMNKPWKQKVEFQEHWWSICRFLGLNVNVNVENRSVNTTKKKKSRLVLHCLKLAFCQIPGMGSIFNQQKLFRRIAGFSSGI